MRLSVCTIAYDEEPFVRDWLTHLEGLADEVILGIDSRTTDHTRDIADELGARTVLFDWQDNFAAARNLTLDRARGDWILVLDPDERLTDAGYHAVRILPDTQQPLHVDGFTPLFAEIGEDGEIVSEEWVSGRLFRNDPQLRYQGRVHEEVRYLPEPPRTWFERMPGGPHIGHLGGTPAVRERRQKDARDLRLLHLRLEDNAQDAVALYYLFRMTGDATYARMALDCGERALHADKRAELERTAVLD